MKLFGIYIFIACLFFIGCEEDKRGPIEDDDRAPGIVTDVTVKNLAGRSVIKYKLPDDSDLLYIKAKYQLNNDVKRVVSASIYSDSLVVDGFGDDKEYNIEVFAVDRSENEGEVVDVKVNPLEPPIKTIKESLELKNTFGGVNIRWENVTNAPVAIVVMIEDTADTGKPFLEAEVIYTSATEGNFNVRGFDTTERDFYCYVRDRWNNYSDTLSQLIEPLFEIEIDKANFEEVILPNDHEMWPFYSSGPSTIPRLWNNELWNENGRLAGAIGTMGDYAFTFDLGQEVKLSRFKVNMFNINNRSGWLDLFLYDDAQVRHFDIFGATTLDPTGSWDSWTKIGTYEMWKPSGLPPGAWNYTDEDKELAYNGHEFEVPLEMGNVRFIRVNVLSTWGDLNWASIAEMTFWGQPETGDVTQ